MRILLADDFLVFRKGVAAVLSRTPGVQVVGEVSNAHQALEAATVLSPDAVILASSLPGDLVDTCTRIKAAVTGVRVILLAGTETEQDLLRQRGAEADRHLLRGANIAELLEALGAPEVVGS